MIKTLIVRPTFKLSIVILFLLIETVNLEFLPELSREIPTPYPVQDATKLKGSIDSSVQSRILKQAPQIIHFPQVNQNQPVSPLSSQWVPPRWFLTSPTSNTLREPVNIPSVIYQDDARFIEKYMKNNFEEGENLDQQSKINLASINHRAPKTDNQQISSNQQVQKRYDDRFNNHQNSMQVNSNHQSQLDLENVRRPDSSEHRSESGLLVKKGRVDDVAVFKPHQGTKFYPPSPAKHFLSSKLDKLDQNCITRASPFTSRCEDHLIRRLNQDATEGRTVLDVGRRVCCALFWHKDCISGIVVNNCADSSPAATDFLIGSRKLDLTLSCQRFNRDGCNGAHGKMIISLSTSLISLLLTSLIHIELSSKNKLIL